DRESEAGSPVRMTLPTLPERVEGTRPFDVAHSASLVDDVDLDVRRVGLDPDAHRALGRRRVEGVVDEVVEDLFQVARHGRGPHGLRTVRIETKVDAVFCGERQPGLASFRNDVGDVDGLPSWPASLSP